ncbi:MAG: PIN domain-containing protein [Methanobrevibacter sp.]|nr:PIN domain-containing protein [Methanobrevibacter sp.]
MPKVKHAEKVISNVVIAETLNGLTGLFNGKQIKELYKILINTHRVYNETREIYENAIRISVKYDGTIGYSDCTIMAIMEKLKIHEIVSFDEDFDNKKGIVRIH